MKRRDFMNTLGVLSGGVLLGRTPLDFAEISSVKEMLKTAVDEEAFWNIVREQFIFPKDYAYFNTGGTGALPTQVLNKIKVSMNESEVNPSPGYNQKKWLEVKEKCTGLLGVGCKKEELALISTATEGINIIVNGLPLKKGDEIITSTHEHAALHIPLLNRMQRDGVVIRAFEPDIKSGSGNVERIKQLMSKRTRLIFVSHITCTTGQYYPLKEIGELAKDEGLWFAVDGAQAAGGMPLNIRNNNIDFYAFSGHKWILGPKRTGVLYVKNEWLDTLKPTTVGAYSDDGYDILKPELKFNPTAQRYEYATQNSTLFYGLGSAVDFIQTISLQKIYDHNRSLSEKFYSGLKGISGVQILSPEEKEYRTSMVTFKIKNLISNEVVSYLKMKRIRARNVPEANLEGIRVSFHIYNNVNEVERILEEIRALVES